MIDRSKAFWAYVWDSEFRPTTPEKRLVIDTANNGGWCIVVSKEYEDDFSRDLLYDTVYFYHYERIEEPEQRLMTREEILGFIAWHPHIVICHKDGNPFSAARWSLMECDIPHYRWAPITESGEIGELSQFLTPVKEKS